jgi:TrmH family RNA methyltransferase
LFTLPVVRLASHKTLFSWCARVRRQLGALQIVGTSASAEQDILDADLTRPTVVAMGNETLGLSGSYRELCDVLIRIPIYGSATSLNVACAASIVLYEVDRQRRTNSQNGSLVL